MTENNKTAFLFAGQGAQFTGMGSDLYEQSAAARNVFDTLNDAADFDLKSFCFEADDQTQKNTQQLQPAIFAVSLAAAAALKEAGIEPQAAAGLSLGEYGALCEAGVFSPEDGMRILARRGQIMAEALPVGMSGMAAVLMLDEEKIAQACSEASDLGIAEIANYNCPGQIVISGEKEAVAKAGEICKSLGAKRVIALPVAGAFHTLLLKDAGRRLSDVLDQFELSEASVPVYRNLTGTPDCADTKDSLSRQISSSVRFTQTIENMIADGVRTFIEIGPGSTLTGFVKKTASALKKKGFDEKITAVSIQNADDLKKITD